jgi:hypothetical protein
MFVCFLFFVRPLKKFLLGMAERVSVRAVRQILLPLALTGSWLLPLLAFRFATLVFAERQLGTTILRLAESLALAWVIIKLSSRLVRSDRLARALAVLAFVIAALNIAGLLGTVTGLLELDGGVGWLAARQCASTRQGRCNARVVPLACEHLRSGSGNAA